MVRSALALVLLLVPFVKGFSPAQPLLLKQSGALALAPTTRSIRGRAQLCQLRSQFDFGGLFGGDKKSSPNVGALKAKLRSACAEARQGIAGTGAMPKEEFEALVAELEALSPTPDPTKR